MGLCACGGLSDLSGDAGSDAALDVHPKKDTGVVDTGPPPYQTQGTKCVTTDAAAPLPWAATGDAGVALHPPVMQSSGGPVLTHPVFVPMTFDGDALRDPIEDFIASVGCTTYWHATAPDYGVGDGVTAPPVHMSDTPPAAIDDSAIGAFIRSKIVSNAAPPPVAGQTLYVIYYPDTTDITLQGSHSCQSFGGYHNEFAMSDGTRVPYAVLPRCDNFSQLGGIDEMTAVSSHELLEAVSDPLPMSTPAYQYPEINGLAWALAGGGEIGDLCEFNSDAFFLPSDYPFYVQHVWTSHTAFLGQNPCQPTTNTYFAAAPTLPDAVSFNFGSGVQQTQGISLALNASKTITLNLISSASWANPITVEVKDGEYIFGGKPALNFGLAVTQGNVGDTLQLTVTRIGTNSQFGLEPFVIRASSAGFTYSWWALVGD